jgi:aryl carrier-like protein
VTDAGGASADGSAGNDAVVEAVAAAWAAELGVGDVDRETGFFDLGADSAAVVRVVGSLRASWPELKIVDVFANPTVTSLAAFLSGSSPAADT